MSIQVPPHPGAGAGVYEVVEKDHVAVVDDLGQPEGLDGLVEAVLPLDFFLYGDPRGEAIF